jgi:hypothetical protein
MQINQPKGIKAKGIKQMDLKQGLGVLIFFN